MQQVEVPVTSVLTRYKEYLKGYYSNLKMRDDGLSITPCTKFVNLAMFEKTGTKTCSSPIGIDSILTPDSNFVLMEGSLGMGKSTLCLELCRNWDTLSSLQCYKVVLLIELRHQVQDVKELLDIFHHTQKQFSQIVVDEICSCEGEGVLLILDGFDEMPAYGKKGELFMKLIRGTCLPMATRLVTSRPSALYRKGRCFPEISRHVKVLGFTEECKLNYVQLTFQSDPKIYEHFEKFMLSNPVISSLMEIPLNCAILAQIYIEISGSEPLIPRTMTQLYSILVRVLIRRYKIKQKEWEESFGLPRAEDLPKDVAASLRIVSELAFKGYFESSNQPKRGFFFRRNVQLIFKDNDLPAGFQPLGLLSETKEMYVCEGARTSYSFLHQSIQDYLAAWHVSCHPELIDQENYNNIEPYFDAFNQFFAGIMGCRNFSINKAIQLGEKGDPLKFKHPRVEDVIRYLYEAQNINDFDFFFPDSGSEELDSYGDDQNKYFLATLNTPMDMYAFGYVLLHRALKWDLQFSTPLKMLVSSLNDHKASNAIIAGSIASLDCTQAVSFDIEILPENLRLSVTKLNASIRSNFSSLSNGMLSLRNLKEVSFTIVESRNEGEHMQYGILANLSSLEQLTVNIGCITLVGLEELSATIARSHTLKFIKLGRVQDWRLMKESQRVTFLRKEYAQHSGEYFLSRLAEAVMSCAAAEKIDIGIPFVTLNRFSFSKIQSMKFDIPGNTLTEERTLGCLHFIAERCSEIMSLKSLEIQILPEMISPFVTLLNNALRCNTSLTQLTVSFYIPADLYTSLFGWTVFNISSLLSALRRDPEIPRLNLKRSKSLTDLSVNHHFYSLPVVRSCSCPDLLGLENMHPLLYRALFGCLDES